MSMMMIFTSIFVFRFFLFLVRPQALFFFFFLNKPPPTELSPLPLPAPLPIGGHRAHPGRGTLLLHPPRPLRVLSGSGHPPAAPPPRPQGIRRQDRPLRPRRPARLGHPRLP